MIILPTRQRLVRRRDNLYKRLDAIIQIASVHQVENIMREIHGINLKLRSYFVRENEREPKEIFLDDDEEDTIETKNPFTIQ
jgi:hypothetical protein